MTALNELSRRFTKFHRKDVIEINIGVSKGVRDGGVVRFQEAKEVTLNQDRIGGSYGLLRTRFSLSHLKVYYVTVYYLVCDFAC